MIADLACGLAQIYDQIYYENFESDKKEQEERARAEAERAQAAAWAAGGPHSGPPGFEGAPRQHPLLTHHVSACCIATPFLPDSVLHTAARGPCLRSCSLAPFLPAALFPSSCSGT